MNDNIFPKLIGSSLAGISEVSIFHPLDTISKRLMSNESRVNIGNINSIILGTSKPKMNDISKLYNGIGFSYMHRFSQRMYTYGGQPILKDKIKNNFNMNDKNSRITCETLAGVIIGTGESIFMPFDVLKIKKQTNPNIFNNRTLIEIIKSENMVNYYKGVGVTTIRNMIGIGNLYFMNSMIRENYYLESNQRNLKFEQYLKISFFTTNVSIFLTSPFDVIKTRMQNKQFGESPKVLNLVNSLLKNEGISAFYKGIVPKFFTIGPKITFSFTMAQYLISILEK